MDGKFQKRVVYWKVRCIDRKTKEFFDRELVLDKAGMTPPEEKELADVLESRKTDLRVLKFRRFFKEIVGNEFERLVDDCTSFTTVNTLLGSIEYFEDENGKPMDEIGLAQILTGYDKPILRGNARSVLLNGPVAIKDGSQWTQQAADNIAHFLHLVREIRQSDWLREPLTIGFQGNAIMDFQHPGNEKTRSILLYVRQLLLKQDDVLNEACEAYLQHGGHDGKSAWVKDVQASFHAARKGTSFPKFLSEYSVEEIIDMVTYGAGAAHRKSKGKWEEKLPGVLQKHGKEKLVFAFQSSCRHLLNYAFGLAAVIEQDFRHWIDTEGCCAPKRVSLNDLLGN